MATSEVQICSNALVLLGADPISNLTESARARMAGNIWPDCRDAVLRSHPWNCSIKRAALAPESTTPAFDWSFQFLLPGDFLRVVAVGRYSENLEYKLEDGRILADVNPLYLRYVYRNEDVTKYDALLTRALTLYIAAELAYPITKNSSEKDRMYQEYMATMKEARSTDGQEDIPDPPTDFPLIAVRGIR